MTSPILFAGGEDIDFGTIGAPVGTTGSIAIDATAGRFRSGFARHGLALSNSSLATSGAVPVNALALITPSLSGGTGGVASAFWISARFFGVSASTNGTSTAAQNLWELRDSNNVLRLRMANTLSSSGPAMFAGPYALFKVNAAGTSTQLGSNTTGGLTGAPAVTDKIDVFVNYAVSGQLTVYINGTQVFNFTGDVTTDGQTKVDVLRLQQAFTSNFNSISTHVWSECIVSTQDTRNLSMVTLTPTGTGNTDTWTAGAATRVNGNLAGDTNPDYSSTASQIQQYQTSQAMPAGSFSVVSLVQHARATVGSSGPQHIDLMVRNGGTDYTSSDLAPTSAWGLVVNNWDTNPNTSAAWQTTDFAATSSAWNVGYKSVA